MRRATEKWQLDVGDMGMIPEPVLMERIQKLRVKVAKPSIHLSEATGKPQFSLKCSTPGASIGYRVKNSGGWSNWKLYSRAVDLTDAITQVESKSLSHRVRNK